MSLARSKFSPRNPVGVDCTGDEVHTKQSMRDQCDINVLMARYLKSGNIDHVTKYQGVYGVVEPVTFMEAMLTVAKGKEVFADMPSEVRKRFANDPTEFLKFVSSPGNELEMEKLGLTKPKPVPTPVAPPA